MTIPNRLLRELGEHAARYNRRTTEHAANCCAVCRRLLTDIIQALMDPANWQAEPVDRQIERLREELDALRAQTGANHGAETVSVAPPINPSRPDGDEPEGQYWNPPPPRDEE